MRLIKLRITNFRRFAISQTLDLNEDLVALVGPNEAGKTSILRALELVGSGESPKPSDRTRGQSEPATVEALFVLEAADVAMISDVHQGAAVTHVWVVLREGARRSWTFEPRPHRDLSPRARVAALVAGLEEQPALDAQFSQGDEWHWDPAVYDDAMSRLESTAETLPPEALEQFESLANRLRNLDYPSFVEPDDDEVQDPEPADVADAQAREAAASALIDLVGIEREQLPATQAVNRLVGQLPDVAFFEQADRELNRDYQMAELAEEIPAALSNLCSLAELDLQLVANDLEAGRTLAVEKQFEDANARLKDRFRSAWTQSKVYPRFGTPLDGTLRVMVSTEDGAYSYPDERSDGLLWFMALHAFLVARGVREPILLVDEAERHLHYDAQADLIDALMNQPVTSKVVYTTHSVGCLPPDLGCGIRVVLAAADAERSRIENSYWSVEPDGDDRVGYTPLLFAMGARMLSLTIPRFGVVTEGPSDAVLLPTLLREATGLRALPYRVVPGLSELAETQVPHLSHHAGSLVCLTDGDSGGKRIGQKLKRAGVPDERILDLGQLFVGCTTEDLVHPSAFAAAVNTEIETWALGPWRVEPEGLPTVGRWTWLQSEGKAKHTALDALNKTRVAQRVVDQGRAAEVDQPVVSRLSPHLVAPLVALHEEILSALGVPDTAV